MAFAEMERLSPNRDPARHERLGVLFHHSQLGFPETVRRMQDPASRVSYHCLIDLDGTRCTLVPDGQVAWHAGESRFLGRSRCNDFLLGVAFAGDTYVSPLSDRQMASALEWLDARWAPLAWGMDRITDHRQVSPGRKRDLNPREWDRLAAAVAGHFGCAAPAASFPC
ncbi:MAG: N-acetylmuramoyl-L-alanine amidase [Opitutaceae bacterium]|jgi:AmpD protein